MIAFAASLIAALLGDAAIIWYSKRRPVGQWLSWAEAMAGATFVFFVMMLWYGVVPHQWITLADTEWGWRADRLLLGPGGILEANRFLPFTTTYVVARDLIVLGIYGLGLGLHVFHFVQWQNRSKAKPVEVATTAYGRPLARKG